MKHVSATIAAAGAAAVIALGAFSTISVSAADPDNPGHHYGQLKNGNNGHHYGQLKHPKQPPPIPSPSPNPVPPPAVTPPPATHPTPEVKHTSTAAGGSSNQGLVASVIPPDAISPASPTHDGGQPLISVAQSLPSDPLWWLILVLLPALALAWAIAMRGVIGDVIRRSRAGAAVSGETA